MSIRRLSPLLLALSALSAAAAERPLTLAEAYGLALKHNEAVALESATADEARARVDELASVARPKLFLRGSELFREQAPGSGRGDNNLKNQQEAKVSLEQPLFSGFRDLAVLKAGRSASRAADHAVKRAEHLLYLDVARAFYDLARLQKESATRDAVLDLTRGRLKEIRDRERLGRSRKSEGLSVESLVAGLEADRAREGVAEREARRFLAFLTGTEGDFRPVEPAPSPVPGLEDAVSKSSTRPDVAARREQVASADQSLSAARREFWPTLGLDGNYYLKREGSQEEVDWDVLLSAELPLFRGGAWPARRAQARARLGAAQSAHGLSIRSAAMEVRAAHDRLTTVLSLIPVLERAVTLAEANAKAQAADYRLGLVTNLDVLNGLENLQEARLQLEEGRLETHLAAAELQVATGEVSPPR